MDLSPGRSLVEFAVSQGIQVFMVVWRNPSSLRGDGKWGLDDYIAAGERAAGVVKKIARTDQLNMLGLCAGGITVSYVLAHLAAIGDDSVKSATFVVTMLTGEKPNVVGMLDTAESRKVLEKAAAAGQIVPGTALRSLFAMLRPNDLVYNYLVSGWLMGKSPAPFDVLAWNDDATRTTAKFALESSRLAMDGWDGNGPTLLGVKTDFSKVTCDSYHVGGYTDHITAWRACYDTAHLVGGARMARDQRSGVVDQFCRSFAVPNLYITDGSVLPTQGAANPALTIMAVAARAAEGLGHRELDVDLAVVGAGAAVAAAVGGGRDRRVERLHRGRRSRRRGARPRRAGGA
jgi:polyhydroxyalkanoate synthase